MSTTTKCTICGRLCIALSVNGAYMCDKHFDAWLKWTVGTGSGVERMADFLAVQREIS